MVDRPPDPGPDPTPCRVGDVSPPAGRGGRDQVEDPADQEDTQYTASMDLDKASLDWLVHKATRARWPASKRHWVQGTSICLGLARGYSGEASINDGRFISDWPRQAVIFSAVDVVVDPSQDVAG